MWKFITTTVLMSTVLGCATAPKTAAERDSLERRAEATLAEMQSRNPELRDVVKSSASYAVFPEVGKGGVLVGGAFGRGVLYVNGVSAGIVKLEQASIGAQLGGQTFAELLVLRDQQDVDRLRAGTYELGANASATVLQAGAAASATASRGTSAYILPRGGLMVDLSVAGQRIEYSGNDSPRS